MQKRTLKACLTAAAALAFVALLPAAASAVSPWQLKNPVGPQRDLRADLKAVCALDGGTAWVAGAGNAVYFTHDGGDSWEVQTTGAPSWTVWRAVRFADRQHGLLLGQAATRTLLYRSADGGRSWTPVALPVDAALSGLELYGPHLAWLVGVRGLVLRSSDGGQSWQRGSVGGPAWGLPAADLNAVDFTGAQEGVVVGAAGAAYRTTDGGRTWTAAAVPARSDLLDVTMRTSQAGWAVGRLGTVLRTTDGGRSWQRIWLLPQPVSYVAVDFASLTHGWIVGATGALLVSEDGGCSWRPEAHTMGALRLRDIDVATPAADTAALPGAARGAASAGPDADTPERAFAAGDGGAVGKYTELGTTSHGNVVWLVPETAQGGPMTTAATMSFQLTTIQYPSDQPYDGWTPTTGWFTQQGQEYQYFILTIWCGREGTSSVADWFTSFCGGNEIGNLTSGDSPASLNFAFNGTLAAGPDYVIALGQGSHSNANNWWLGGPGYTIVNPMSYAFPSIATPDSAWEFLANEPTGFNLPGNVNSYAFIMTPD